MPRLCHLLCMILGVWFISTANSFGKDFMLTIRSQRPDAKNAAEFVPAEKKETWAAKSTAVIVCDVWDLHHCLNAVRRLEEFAPRLNDVLKEARRNGATIIHSPSDCMDAYAEHPARRRAIETPQAAKLPPEIDIWCSRIPSEEKAVYPIDQSDGGEDDDPAEHAEWAAKLKAMGRNPAAPWKKQLDVIEIDPERDFISDRGSEVWSILESRGINQVILTGVHCNMCVLGRPFGLRQMARNGKRVVLMRDMTDCMYNPKRWPFVDHFTGNDLMIAHVERYVCPTITSDQIIGGQPFRSKFDQRQPGELRPAAQQPPKAAGRSARHWSSVTVPLVADSSSEGLTKNPGPVWLRCTVRIPQSWQQNGKLRLLLPNDDSMTRVWLNGHPLTSERSASTAGRIWQLKSDEIFADDANLLVVRGPISSWKNRAPVLKGGDHELALTGRWQIREDDDPSHANMPLPAKFGTSTDIVFDRFSATSR